MISKKTQSKLLASRILYVTQPVSEESFWHVGIVGFAVLAVVHFLFWS